MFYIVKAPTFVGVFFYCKKSFYDYYKRNLKYNWILMTVAEMVQELRNDFLQNMSFAFYTDSQLINKINDGINYIYNYIHSSYWWWHYALISEVLEADNDSQKTFTTSYDISVLHQVLVPSEKFWVYSKAWVDFQELYQNQKQWHNRFSFFISWENKVTISEEMPKVKVVYNRFPVKHTVADMDNWTKIDLPVQLRWALNTLVLSSVSRKFDSSWRNVSNNDLEYANTLINNYVTNIWKNSALKQFTH